MHKLLRGRPDRDDQSSYIFLLSEPEYSHIPACMLNNRPHHKINDLQNSDLMESITRLRKNKKVYIYDTPDCPDVKWQQYQEREKAFWTHKINNTSYNPNPESDFSPFLKHWEIDASFFKDKTVLEIGSGPFGFFPAIAGINHAFVPHNLVIVDPLMDFYQQFELSNLIPENAIRIQAPGEKLPLPDNKFDVAVVTNTIDHVENYYDFMNEVNRVLTNNGVLLFSVHTIRRLIVILKPIIKTIDRNHPHHFSTGSVKKLIKETSFQFLTHTTVPMYKENPIPSGVGIISEIAYLIGFRMMECLYGVAQVIK